MSDNEYVLDVKFNTDDAAKKLAELTKRLAETKEQQRDLNDKMKEGGADAATSAKKYADNAKEITQLQRDIKTYTAILQDQRDQQDNVGESINGMRTRLNSLLRTYDTLTETERNNSKVGGVLQNEITALTDKLKNLESATGRNQRNVGNYAASILEASKGMGGLGSTVQKVVNPVKNADGALKAMAANPIMAIISVLVTIVLKLTDAFKKNGAAMEGVTKVFGVFSGVGNMINRLIDGIAGSVAKLVDGFINLADKLGLVSDEMKEAIEISEQQLQLSKDVRAAKMAEADAEVEVAELREKASDRESYTLQERIDFLNEAAAKEQAIADERVRIAQKEYDLQVQINAQSKSGQKDLDAEAEKYVALQQAIAGASNKQREYNNQLKTLNRQAESEEKAAQKAAADRAKQAREARQRAAEEAAKAQKEIEIQLIDQITNAIEDEGERAIALRKLQGQREIDALKDRLANEKNLTDKAKNDLAQLIKLKQETLDKELSDLAQKQADEKTKAELDKERSRSNRLRDLRIELADADSLEALELQKERLDAEMQAELENVELTEEEKALIREKYNQQKEVLDNEYRKRQSDAEKAATEQYKQKVLNTVAQAQVLFDSMSGLADAFIGDEKKRVKAQKAFGLANIAISEGLNIADTARAISKAVANATEAAGATGPAAIFTQPIFIAELVSAVLGGVAGTAANIASAKKLISGQAFAEGGIVAGNSYSGDNVLVRANSGEMFINRTQQARLFDMLNSGRAGGIDYDAMSATLINAFANAPAPILDYREFTAFQQNVAKLNEFSTL